MPNVRKKGKVLVGCHLDPEDGAEFLDILYKENLDRDKMKSEKKSKSDLVKELLGEAIEARKKERGNKTPPPKASIDIGLVVATLNDAKSQIETALQTLKKA